jgi:hypothetical protein
MMARNQEFTAFVADAQKQALQSMKETQDLSIRWLELVSSAMPKAAIPAVKPSIEAAFNVASQVLAVQKSYVLALADAFGESKPATT